MQVERVNYKIRWHQFKAGASFFIPCLDPPKAWKRISKALAKRKIQAVHKVVIEDGVRGVRVWRVMASSQG